MTTAIELRDERTAAAIVRILHVASQLRSEIGNGLDPVAVVQAMANAKVNLTPILLAYADAEIQHALIARGLDGGWIKA